MEPAFWGVMGPLYLVIGICVFAYNRVEQCDPAKVSLNRATLWPLIVVRTLVVFVCYQLPLGAWDIIRYS